MGFKEFNSIWLSCFIILQYSVPAYVYEVRTAIAPNTPLQAIQTTKITEFSHQIWDQLLKKYVSTSGSVNYKGFIREKENLVAYLDLLSANTPQPTWSRAKSMAWWINAYNSFTVKLIVDNYPVKSIRDLEDPWDTPFIKLGSQSYTLNQIEHDILRARYKDPRIHFVINCASYSCPSLPAEALSEDNIDSMLEHYTRAFINDSRHNSLSFEKAVVSSLFNWYKEDFTQNGTVIGFINKYAETKLSTEANIDYKLYNWNLNE